jgi:hypothetical protein
MTVASPWRYRRLTQVAAIGCVVVMLALGGVWGYAGIYGLHVLFRHGGTWWVPVSTTSRWISPSMRLALGAAPLATPGGLTWRTVDTGFDTADLPAMVDGHDVDHVLLARIDPARFRFEVRTAYQGNVGLDQWMSQLHPALVVNGSYSGRNGRPATPVLSGGAFLGPQDYNATAGAFVSAATAAAVLDLSQTSWKTAFQGAQNAMVSFPLLLADGKTRVPRPSRWLANRSFVGQDHDGRIVIGTTTDAFFPLDRFAQFLLDAPLGLATALNLDGGPVASQAISWKGFNRRSYGRWEAKVDGDTAQLLVWPYGTVAMPVVLAVFAR